MTPLILFAGMTAVVGIVAIAWIALRRSSTTEAPAFSGLRERDFESLVAEAFRAQGYEPIGVLRGEAMAMAKAGELVLRRERVTYLVDCRHRRAGRVGVDAVQALQRVMAARGAAGGFMLSGGRFSREAVAFAAGCDIRLVDGPALQAMLARAKSS